ncbi:squalene/phytoene synthase family protein [Paenibacillus sp. N4]|uniref:squalene/phytoene synthase family protein n=1 Tax=Paenibacillus vietnamensis TaxID=2590547 RepID=UPI001CD0F3D3|nr:squalene/phytoene synthase family protein [Paenibacillus vietnamensis]MCA0757153.1 squalene/phytoene synthase family protein [Paenibacillus vietnamensis]
MEGAFIVIDAMGMLQKTSRTFFIPINRLVPGLKEAVASAYLCMRAIDEIEDHETLADELKIGLLQGVHDAFQSGDAINQTQKLLAPHRELLPEVSLRLDEWALYCPPTVTPVVYRYIAKMAKQMAEWVHAGWTIRTEADLDGYTYSVAGMVGEMLSEIWFWFDGTKSDMKKAVAFGRGLQAVNILRNRTEDLERGVDFYPDGWGSKEMLKYTRRNLKIADSYIEDLRGGPALDFCKIPLKLAHATVNLISVGGNKLTRDAVLKLVNSLS